MQETKNAAFNAIESPTQEIIKSAAQITVIEDKKGRKITLKKPNVLMQYRLVEMMGDSSKNEVYMRMVLPLMFVQSIDGIPVSLNKKSEVEALIQRLDEAVDDVIIAVNEKFAARASEEEEKEKIKK